MVPFHGVGWNDIQKDTAEDAAVDIGAHFFLRELDTFEGFEKEGTVFVRETIIVTLRVRVGVEDFAKSVLV